MPQAKRITVSEELVSVKTFNKHYINKVEKSSPNKATNVTYEYGNIIDDEKNTQRKN